MNPSSQNEGAWIFVSHSHRDLEKVREIRNYLEEKGANPLLFYLKCLDDDDPRLPELIADEIRARNFFVICGSPNAKASRYVPKEVALIRSEKPPETIADIDLTEDLTPQLDELAKKATTSAEQSPVDIGHTQLPEPQISKLDRLLRRATVFLSYSRKDHEIAEQIQRALLRHDYRVWSDADLPSGSDWAFETRTALDEAAKHGFVLVLLSRSLLKSEYCQKEISHALRMQGNIIPITIEKCDWSELPPPIQYISYLQIFDLTTGPFEERIEELIRNLKIRDME